MKNLTKLFVSTLVLLFIFPQFTTAQTRYKRDSIQQYNTGFISQIYMLSIREHYTYDNGGEQPTNYLRMTKIESEWVNNIQTNYEYDNNNALSIETHQNWDRSTNSWVDSNRTTYTYDTNKQLATETHESWSILSNVWQYTTREENSYDDSGRPTKTIYYNSVNFTNEWIPSSETENIYGSNTSFFPIATIDRDYDEDSMTMVNESQTLYTSPTSFLDFTTQTWVNGAWQNESKIETLEISQLISHRETSEWDIDNSVWNILQRTINERNAQGNTISSTLQLELLEGQGLVNVSRSLSTYTNNLRTELISQNWNSTTNTWVNASRNLYSHDINDNITENIRQNWDSASSTWINSTRITDIFDENNNKIEDSSYNWDLTTATWVINRSTLTFWSEVESLGIDLANAFITKIYPNPFDSQLQIELKHPVTQEGNILLLDINGRAILSHNLNQGVQDTTINTNQLKSGLYFVHINSDNQNMVSKIIKQ